jgi:NAD(P)-dependent dehydrogenase (short-subunit alcohol dehydrogenase family)
VTAQPHREDDAGLPGRVAIITGGGALGDGIGNGRAAAVLLARAGTKVLVVDRDLKLAARIVEMIAAVWRRHDGGQHDLSGCAGER